MKNPENEKFTMQAMMAFDQRNITYAVQHSRHICSRGVNAPNETTRQVEGLAANSISSYNQNDSVRVWRA